jgi:hypothetical protein
MKNLCYCTAEMRQSLFSSSRCDAWTEAVTPSTTALSCSLDPACSILLLILAPSGALWGSGGAGQSSCCKRRESSVGGTQENHPRHKTRKAIRNAQQSTKGLFTSNFQIIPLQTPSARYPLLYHYHPIS